MADPTPNANPSQPYLPAPPPAPRRVPRPTPIGVLAGLVLLLLCVAGGVTVALLTSGRADATPTPSPATAVSTNDAGTATAALTGEAVGGTATLPALPALPGTPSAVATSAQPPGPVPTGGLPEAVSTAAASGPMPVGTAGGAPIATAAPATATVPATTATPLPAPTDTPAPPSPTPAIGASEAGYIADFQAQTARWSAALTAFNAVLADAAPSDAVWVARARGATAPIKLLARDAAQLQAPPNLGTVDTEYKAGAAHYAQAIALLERWLTAQDSQTLQQFNTEMRAGSMALQSAEDQMAVFQANPSGGPAPPPLPPVVAPPAPTPTLAPPAAAPTVTVGSTTDLPPVPPSATPGTNDINTTAGDSTN